MNPSEVAIGIVGHIVIAIALIGVSILKPGERINSTALLVLSVALFSSVYFWVRVLS